MALRRSIRTSGPRAYQRTLGPAHLFLDDVETIRQSLSDAAAQRAALNREDEPDFVEGDVSVSVSAGPAEADDVDDLREAAREEIDQLSLSLRNPRIQVNLWRRGADVSADAEDDDAQRLADDIAKFVENHRHWSRGLRFSPRGSTVPVVALLGAGVLLGATGLQVLATGQDLGRGIPALVIALGIFLAVPVTTRYTARKSGSVRVLQVRRSEARRSGRNTRRDIAIAVLAASAGAVIIAVLSH
jgi:hypothetical protein